MKKIKKNLTINIALLVLVVVFPLYIFRQYQNDSIHIELIQKIVFTVLLCGSVLITFINNRNRVRMRDSKWLWVIFEAMGVMGIIYSLVVFYLIFALQNIGF